MQRIEVREPGGPERMLVADVPVPEPGPNDVLIAVSVSGVNFIDVYFRSGLYKSDLPIALGSEAAGTVERVGSEVRDVSPGDRVVYAMTRGSYAEYAVVPALQVAKVPADVSDEVAAAVMLQGTTAHYLTRSTFPLNATHACLVHAAAGGTGGLIVQLAKAAGARVFGTVSTEEKVREVRALGADEVIVYTRDDFEREVKRLTDGRGVDVVYDSVGKATFDRSLRVLRPRGMMVLFGQSSGAVPPFDPAVLSARGSLFLTRPSLAHYLATPGELRWRTAELMTLVTSGALQVRVSRRYPLAQAAAAHRDLESRATTGKLLLRVRG